MGRKNISENYISSNKGTRAMNFHGKRQSLVKLSMQNTFQISSCNFRDDTNRTRKYTVSCMCYLLFPEAWYSIFCLPLQCIELDLIFPLFHVRTIKCTFRKDKCDDKSSIGTEGSSRHREERERGCWAETSITRQNSCTGSYQKD